MKRLSLVLTLVLAAARVPAVAQGQPAASPTPQGKRPAQAKTQPEFKDYNAAYAITGGSQMEAAANNFAKKYPDSELRQFLYAKAMHEYQTENNPAKMLVMGEKILTLDPDDPIALVLTATVLSDQLSDGDPNRAQVLAEIKKNAGRALETVDTSLAPPAGATPEQIAAYKDTLRSMAYSALGIMDLKTGDDTGAERELRSAADLSKTQPDPYIWYHLALAQDHQKKYTEALASVEQALRYIGSNADLGKLANGERDRLQQLTGGANTPAPGSSKPTPPPH
jgi:tetratricopeptide (TPR) repeat protein